jgi:hypothetical protein
MVQFYAMKIVVLSYLTTCCPTNYWRDSTFRVSNAAHVLTFVDFVQRNQSAEFK